MSEKKQIYKPKPVSGFPEWLPQERMIEQQWLDHIRRVFESYGYCSIETPAVEELNVITAKGGDGGADVDKEVYVIERLHKEENDKEARLALHFDQTVPFARYVAQHFNELTFPFKRYQMQKVWRGERPQAGRFREFYQCDIDVINPENLPLHFDAEMPAVIWEILSALPGMENEKIQLRISNRKILIGLLETLGIKNIVEATRIIDKKQKVGEQDTYADLLKLGFDDKQLETIIELVDIQTSPLLFSGLLRDFIARNDVIARSDSDAAIQTFNEGIAELSFVMESLKHLPEGSAIADLSIVRGLDYYTGTVYETVFLDNPEYGSICSGGRYDDLAGNYINKYLPGVGISIGFSRLFARLKEQGKLPKGRQSAAHVLVMLMEEAQRGEASAKAKALRDVGYNVEMYHAAAKFKKQMEYAEKKGIPFIFVPMDESAKVWEIKDMAGRTQKPEAEGLKDLERYANENK